MTCITGQKNSICQRYESEGNQCVICDFNENLFESISGIPQKMDYLHRMLSNIEAKTEKSGQQNTLLSLLSAIESNEASVWREVARIFSTRYDLNSNEEIAVFCLEKAILKNDVNAMIELGVFYKEKRRVNKSFHLFMNVVKEYDHEQAWFNMGDLYYSRGEYQDDEFKKILFEDALDFYYVAANKNYADAFWKIYLIFAEKVVIDDDILTQYWFDLAAQYNCIEAQLQLANEYKKGINRDKDLYKAVYWYKKAAEKNIFYP